MAGNKVNTKSKSKDDKGKSKDVSEDNDDIDFALLRKPIPTSITGFAQARKMFDLATEELKEMLSSECDLLYECKVCRNLFRSLGNFISHKRVYCKEKFNSSIHSHFVKAASMASEVMKIRNIEQIYKKSLQMQNGDNVIADEERIPMSKDLTDIVEHIARVKGVNKGNNDQIELQLQKIPSSSVAVFQNVNFNEERQTDKIKAQVKEIDHIISKNQAVLQSDGKFTIVSSMEQRTNSEGDNVIQISDDEDDNCGVLKCKICDLQFSTQKTLKFHMKTKHLESRLVYPCPDCLEIFSTSWSVYRHLFKVHRKTAAQIRRLRESIQAKAFKMDNPPAFYEKRKNTIKTAASQKITEEERLEQENQAWMDNMEGDGEIPRCGGCGRTFERRAALAAHTATCLPRSRALARRPDERIKIQIRKDYNKGTPAPAAALTIIKSLEVAENKPTKDEEQEQATLTPIIGTVSKADDEDNDGPGEAPMDISDNDQMSLESESPEKNTDERDPCETKLPFNLPHAIQAEKSNLAAFRQRISMHVDFTKYLCKKCDAVHKNVIELYEHMAEHFKWMRYACKLCNFKHYDFVKLPEHVKVVHKLKGDTDFYFSTVKAVDGTEAMIISRCLESEGSDEVNENCESGESRRPSRCSSDSSRLSDDSSSSSTIKETGSRKRKMFASKNIVKKKKESISNDANDERDSDVSSINKSVSCNSIKAIEENSSDMDDSEEKINKRHTIERTSTVASRRPVRKKIKRKNEDFEYDLSNLLKMEAQGYRDSQTVSTSKPTLTKKKTAQETTVSVYELINRDCCGALGALSKKAVDRAAAHLRTSSFAVFSVQRTVYSNVFARPMLPKIKETKADKMSPKKDVEDPKDMPSPKSQPQPVNSNVVKALEPQDHSKDINKVKIVEIDSEIKSNASNEIVEENVKADLSNYSNTDEQLLFEPNSKAFEDSKDAGDSDENEVDKDKTKQSVSNLAPMLFPRKSIDFIKNPIINKNITDFSKAGMKTKILVIKPINRNNNGTPNLPGATPLKFQRIKIKDPNIRAQCESLPTESNSNKMVVVKMPKIASAASNAKQVPNKTSDKSECSVLDVVDDAKESPCKSKQQPVNSNELKPPQPQDQDINKMKVMKIDSEIKNNASNEVEEYVKADRTKQSNAGDQFSAEPMIDANSPEQS